MSELAFLSVDAARTDDGFEPRAASPLARALAGAEGVRDLSLVGKLEVRGDVSELDVADEVVRLTPTRALVLGGRETREQLRESGYFVLDLTAALAGLELEAGGEQVLRRLTELDLRALPAVGAVARVRTIVLREGDRFRLFFPQEYGHYVVEVVLDAIAGLALVSFPT